jgi:hypothetical protein
MADFDPLKAYSSGFVGCQANPRADEEFADSIIRHGGDPDGGNIAHQWEFAEAGKGKLSLIFPAIDTVFPGALPGPAQLWGCCVAASAAHCFLGSLAQEIVDGKPDEVTGIVEGPPDIPELGVRQGVIARESIFAWRGWTEPNGRGKASDGWFCSAAAKAVTEKGVLLRKPYPELGFDLTKYTKETIRLGGATKPSDKWLAESKQYVARTATFVNSREQVRDFLAAGYAIFNCSSMGFERTRNEDGVSRQVGIWHHAQAFTGYDDRDIVIKKYGQPLVLWTNSWGAWNTGPRTILGTSISIPPGSYWALANTIDKCQCIALSSVAGWPRRKHTTFGAAGNV